MKKVYLDNAATTAIDREVLAEMLPYLTEHYGNPSSIHGYGRKAKAAIEQARKILSKYLNASTSEIYFTGSGSEANNMIIKGAVHDLGVTRIISSRIEHHCVLHSIERMSSQGIAIEYIEPDVQGRISLAQLETLLKADKGKTLVSLMHANNEIGTMIDIDAVAALCGKYGAMFHSDTVQTIGYFPFDLQKTKIHFITGSAHKLHGPKGIGFAYVDSGIQLSPLIDGGAQERNMRAGTENVAGIVGMGKALDIAQRDLQKNYANIAALKNYMLTMLRERIPGIEFNGVIDPVGSNYKVLSVSLPHSDKSDLLLFNLDIAGIAASGGSACSSGTEKGSHVLEGIKAAPDRKSIRFSFSKYNTKEEIDYTVESLQKFL